MSMAGPVPKVYRRFARTSKPCAQTDNGTGTGCTGNSNVILNGRLPEPEYALEGASKGKVPVIWYDRVSSGRVPAKPQQAVRVKIRQSNLKKCMFTKVTSLCGDWILRPVPLMYRYL